MKENSWVRQQLQKHGLTTIVPDSNEDRKNIYNCICQELSFNIFTNESRQKFIQYIHQLIKRGAQGIILGCTEIELLIQQEHIPEIPIFPTAKLHIDATIQVQAKKMNVEDFMPKEDLMLVTQKVRYEKRYSQIAFFIFTAFSIRLLSSYKRWF